METGAAEPIGRVPAIAAGPLYSQKVHLRPGSGTGQEEGPFAAAYLQFHGPGITEQIRKANRAPRDGIVQKDTGGVPFPSAAVGQMLG